MSTTLCMTIRDEAKTLQRALDSCLRYVDAAVIGIDSRTTDETRDIVQSECGGAELFEYTEASPPHFARMRNRALDRVKTDWALVLDGDEWLVNGSEMAGILAETPRSVQSIQVRMMLEPRADGIPTLTYAHAHIHRRSRRFVGAMHEHVNSRPDQMLFRPELEVWHQRAEDPSTVQAEGNTEDALRVLETAARGGETRAMFYLANGLREKGAIREATKWYVEYLKRPGWAEEAFVARLYLARCLYWIHMPVEAIKQLLDCVGMRPWRAEPAMVLGEMFEYQGMRDHALAWFRYAASLPLPETDILFIEAPIYLGDAAKARDRLMYGQERPGTAGDEEEAHEAAG